VAGVPTIRKFYDAELPRLAHIAEALSDDPAGALARASQRWDEWSAKVQLPE
jgi:hypothetical protein